MEVERRDFGKWKMRERQSHTNPCKKNTGGVLVSVEKIGKE